ncbi:hypothetical protein FDUTEX481_09562 [Tolypothrix sp. PCC 7601]|nr:hypothetical protein FDUTEX481_09562 [Tolypothrix sp. PCC 7601]
MELSQDRSMVNLCALCSNFWQNSFCRPKIMVYKNATSLLAIGYQ